MDFGETVFDLLLLEDSSWTYAWWECIVDMFPLVVAVDRGWWLGRD